MIDYYGIEAGKLNNNKNQTSKRLFWMTSILDACEFVGECSYINGQFLWQLLRPPRPLPAAGVSLRIFRFT